ncbi:MAG: Trm112 family protein [bacterium]
MKKYIELLEILCCPICKSDLEFVEKYFFNQETDDELLSKIKNQEISGYKCPKCNILFPIIEEIPVFLIDKTIKLNE